MVISFFKINFLENAGGLVWNFSFLLYFYEN
jgi:hypothetical protein